ncbi:MAG: UDP-N-acetylglucosamine--N-acetylmuramyl-(pentapeptide) pyrophosphoryl-undecaprenol N-acetylglucosamine transferase [Myxococcota bacterium]|jgi:UDP-N-acetylglucosamine--N-acetylmuramyl-(pentapeptide) pyrophosphoryl-undecaprenol N-acetylglucosamine transferase
MSRNTQPLVRVVIAGGGTGGHVYPGVAIAEEVLRRNPDAAVSFIGTTRGMESKILPKLGLDLDTITVSRLKGGGVWGRIKGLLRLPVGIWQSWRILRRRKPQVVIGVGGYASGPALIAAWLTWRKTAIQEQNATPGLTNRWLGKVVKTVFLGFQAGASYFKPKKVVFTGNPVRQALAERLAGTVATDGAEATLRVLVFGGSQGARFLNEQVPAALVALQTAHPDLQLSVTHQTGATDEAITRQRYVGTPLSDAATVTPFIHDMPTAYANADVAVCRAGALTVAEVTAVGLPALLVPFPFAADNHQEANAQVVVDAGAGWMVRQEDWDQNTVVAWLADLARDRTKRGQMSDAARGIARLDAAQTIVDHLEGLAQRQTVASGRVAA